MSERAEMRRLMEAGRDKEYFVEINNDDDTFAIVVGRFYWFDQAVRNFEGLIASRPQMRVTMRHMAHVYRHYVPDRLQAARGRRAMD